MHLCIKKSLIPSKNQTSTTVISDFPAKKAIFAKDLQNSSQLYKIMYQKFIINQEGVLKFGRVYQHRDLLDWNEDCPYGGGLWKLDEGRRAILLYGRSFAFGAADFNQVRRIEWSGIGGTPYPLFFLPHWPKEESMIPVYAKPY